MPEEFPEKKILTGVAVHISSEPNIAGNETRPTKRFIRISGRPKVSRQAVEHLHRSAGKLQLFTADEDVDQHGGDRVKHADEDPARMITLTKDFEPPFTSLTYTATDSAPPAAIKIHVVIPRNAQLEVRGSSPRR